jgi:hypothetical protein
MEPHGLAAVASCVGKIENSREILAPIVRISL